MQTKMNEQQTSRSCAEYIRGQIDTLEGMLQCNKGCIKSIIHEELYWYKEILRCLQEKTNDKI